MKTLREELLGIVEGALDNIDRLKCREKLDIEQVGRLMAEARRDAVQELVKKLQSALDRTKGEGNKE